MSAAKPGILLSENYAKAIAFAISQHEGQYRKGNRAPYVSHPMAVSSLVLEHGGDEEQAIAAILHDVIEDCDVESEELVEKFGAAITKLVEECTEQVSKVGDNWRERKDSYLAQIETISQAALLVVLADKFHNLSSLARDLEARGEAAWVIFREPKEKIAWYYQEIIKRVQARQQSEELSLGHARLLNSLTKLYQQISAA